MNVSDSRNAKQEINVYKNKNNVLINCFKCYKLQTRY